MKDRIELTQAQRNHHANLALQYQQVKQQLELFSQYLATEHEIEGEGWTIAEGCLVKQSPNGNGALVEGTVLAD